MLWALAAYLMHIIEMGILSHAVKGIGPLTVIPLFYFFTFTFLYLNNVLRHRDFNISPLGDIKNHKFKFLLFIIGGIFGNGLWFFSLSFLGIGAVTFILVFIRVLVTAYSWFFMNDRYPADKVVAIITTFFAVIVFSFSGDLDNLTGALLAGASCIFFALETIARKELSQTPIKPKDTVILRSIILGIASTILLFICHHYGIVTIEVIDNKTLSLIGLAALLGGVLSNIFIFMALRHIPLSSLESLNATKPVAMTIIGIAFLSETITSLQVVMGIIIIASSLYFLWPRSKKNEKQNTSNP